MIEVPYLVRLGTRLAAGLSSMPTAQKEKHRNFLLGFQCADGGFRGREGDSDLYYTSFAVRGLAMLDALDPETVASISSYLARFDAAQLSTLDAMNWLSTGMALQWAGGPEFISDQARFSEELAIRLEATRTADGGYAKSSEGATGSTYHSFLTLLTYQLLGRSLPRPNALLQFLYDRQRDDGGFVEIAPMKRSGTNPTAAAAAILQELNRLDRETVADIQGFLRDVRQPEEGGFQANSRIPFADSLSTFTGILTAQTLKLTQSYDAATVRGWVLGQLKFPDGGFRAAAWDNAADVEYSFYGLGILALLSYEPNQ